MTPGRLPREITGSANPEYVNSRVRTRRKKLFDDDDYRKLIRMGTSGVARFLEESEYEDEINTLGARYSGVDLIEYALNRNIASHFRDLLRWSDGRVHDQIAKYLRKYDVWNIKTVLRGIYTDSDPEEIKTDFIRAGELSDRVLDQMAESESIDNAVNLLDGTVYHNPLVEAMSEYQDTNALVPLENALDREFYTLMMEGMSAIGGDDGATRQYVEFLQAEIDFRNTRNALRLARSGADMDPAEYFIDGGRLFTPEQLRQLVNNTDELVGHIRESRYGEELSDALNQLEQAESLIQFEHALDAALLKYSDRLASVYPMSITTIMSYILAKEREVENIRAIARGREVGLSEEEIEEELVIL